MFVKLYNLIKREFAYTTQLDSTGKGKFLVYGTNNAFPLKLSELVQSSPTASSCVDTIADFITGEGFNDPKLEKLIVNNQGLSMFEFHAVISASLALFDGFAFEVKYSRTGNILELYNLPFEGCRLGKPDSNGVISKVFYNPYFGADALYKESDNKDYDVYDSRPEIAIRQFEQQGQDYKGQIFYYSVRTPLNIFYPRPKIYSAKDAMEVERRTLESFNKNLQSGFLQSMAIKLIGDPNEPMDGDGEDTEGNRNRTTKGEAFNDMMTTEFSGSERTGAVMAFWGNNKDEWPELQAFPTYANSEIYRTQSELAAEKIMIATKTPAILVVNREGQSLGGDGNTIRAATKVMQQRSVRPQNTLTDTYKAILLRLAKNSYSGDLRITPYNPFPEIQNVDPSVWAELTQEEKRKWIKDNTEIVLLEVNPEPQPTQARMEAVSYNTYPEKARDNAKRALEWQDSTGNKCGGNAGREMAKRIADGHPVTGKEIKRLANYLSKNTIYKDRPWDKSCDAVAYHAWGGSDMMVWATERVKEWLS